MLHRITESAPIRVLVTDDHAAVRAGLRALLDSEPGMEVSGEATDAFDLAPAIYATKPDVVVLDYQLPGGDGITLCRTLKQAVSPPAVVLYSAFVGEAMIVPAHVAGADALIDKAVEPRELTLAVRRVAAGDDLLPEARTELLDAAAERVEERDVPALRHLVGRASRDEKSGETGQLGASIDRILSALVVTHRA